MQLKIILLWNIVRESSTNSYRSNYLAWVQYLSKGQNGVARQHQQNIWPKAFCTLMTRNSKQHTWHWQNLNPQFFLMEPPRLIDEWQMSPKLWDAARFIVDRRKQVGQFIFTGSSVPADFSLIEHSGAGRFAWLRMRPMTLWESGSSNGSVSLTQLFDNQAPEACASEKTGLKQIAELLCRGGWPGSLDLPDKAAYKIPYNYIDAVCKTDISKVDGIRRDASFTYRLLRSYARNQGQQVSIAALYQDLLANEGSTLSEDTIASYINALKKVFIIEDIEAWNPNLRSKTAIRSSDTRYFVDPSIALFRCEIA